MINNKLNSLWEIANEIEGLILLADKKGGDSYESIFQQIKQKTQKIAIEIDVIESIKQSCNQISIAENKDFDNNMIPSDEPEDERAHGNLDDDYIVSDDEFNEKDKDLMSKNSEETIIDDVDEVNDSMEENVVITTDEDNVEILDDELEIVESEIEVFDDYDDSFDNLSEESSLTVEEKIAINESRDLRHAFTLNDKYRFRRELFANSDIEMTDTINLISAMSSLSEAEEYFYEDLQWDPNSDEVIDFIAIIKKHFVGKTEL